MAYTREEWLERATVQMQDWISQQVDTPAVCVHVSVGFTGSKCQLDKVLGACWKAETSQDGNSHIFISPINQAPVDSEQGVLATLLHELVHATLGSGVKSKHGKEFAALAGKLGLVGPWSATKAGPELLVKLQGLSQELGEFPHSPLVLPTRTVKAREILLGDKLGKEARIIIPSQTEFGDAISAETLTEIFHQAAELFGGFTAFTANGGYIMADGKYKEEVVTALDIAMPATKETKQKLECFAEQLKQMAQQETVYLRLPSGIAELI